MATSFVTQVARSDARPGVVRVDDRKKGGFLGHIGKLFKRDGSRRDSVVEVPSIQRGYPQQPCLLPPLAKEDAHKKTLVLDLDETLIHSGFKPVGDPDFVLSVEMDAVTHTIWVQKRPWVEHFLHKMAEKYELVIFTASLGVYANPLLNILDKEGVIKHRLFRESCTYYKGSYVKDLTLLNRDMGNVMIIDNSPLAYQFQVENAVPIISWFDDMDDLELLRLIPMLESLATAQHIVPSLEELRMLGKLPTF